MNVANGLAARPANLTGVGSNYDPTETAPTSSLREPMQGLSPEPQRLKQTGLSRFILRQPNGQRKPDRNHCQRSHPGTNQL